MSLPAVNLAFHPIDQAKQEPWVNHCVEYLVLTLYKARQNGLLVDNSQFSVLQDFQNCQFREKL